MPEQIYSEAPRKILQNKKQIEDSLNVNIEIKSGVVTITGKAENELIAFQIIEALNMGFSLNQAMDLKNDEFAFEKILIKSLSHRKDLSQVRARVIGTERRVLRNIEYLTDCSIVLHKNTVGIIGRVEDLKKASYAVKKLISGSKHANVYKYLEEQKVLEKIKGF